MRRLLICFAMLLPAHSFAALNAAIEWEVRTTGATTNGGGFKAGASGTDWTQQDAAQYSVTDAVTAGTTTITSASANFGTDVVGNVLYIEGGTAPITAGWYEITARTNSTTITVDRSTGLTTGTGATLKIGGALLTLSNAALCVVAGNTVHVKQGTYNETLTLSVSGGNATPIQWRGYASARGDYPTGATRPTVDGQSTRANCLVIGVVIGNSFRSFIFTGGTSHNVTLSSASSSYFTDVKSTLAGGDGFNSSSYLGLFLMWGVEASANSDDGMEINGPLQAQGLNVHSNTDAGLVATSSVTAGYVLNSIIHANGSHGVSHANSALNLLGLTVYNNSGASTDGLRFTAATSRSPQISNIISAANGRYGLNENGTITIYTRNMGYYANGTAATNGSIVAFGTDLTSDPGFVDAAGGNFAIGTNYKAAGMPGVFPGGLSTGYMDLGAVQRQEPSAGGGLPILGGSIIK